MNSRMSCSAPFSFILSSFKYHIYGENILHATSQPSGHVWKVVSKQTNKRINEYKNKRIRWTTKNQRKTTNLPITDGTNYNDQQTKTNIGEPSTKWWTLNEQQKIFQLSVYNQWLSSIIQWPMTNGHPPTTNNELHWPMTNIHLLVTTIYYNISI